MSAFIVDDAHISAIIRFAAFHQVSFYHPVEKTHVQVDWNNADDMGRLLLAENVRSVNFRYNETMTDDWRDTPAAWLLRAIQSEAISQLPGYGAAEWHITD